jgi:hypothetical protein
MIRIRVDLIPVSAPHTCKRLATVELVNTGRGTGRRGEYGARLYKRGDLPDVKGSSAYKDVKVFPVVVQNWPRLSQPVLALVVKALVNLGFGQGGTRAEAKRAAELAAKTPPPTEA